LTEKHWKAIKLLDEGNLTNEQVAHECGWSRDYLQQMIAGNVERGGQVALLFRAEVEKIEEKLEKSIKTLNKKNSEMVLGIMQRVLFNLQQKKTLTPREQSLLVHINTSLAKSKSSVHIGSLSYSYTKGLTPAELLHEFTRLKGIAEGSFNRRTVLEAPTGGAGELSSDDEPGD